MGFAHFREILADSAQIGAESVNWPFWTYSGRFCADRRRISVLTICGSRFPKEIFFKLKIIARIELVSLRAFEPY